MSGSVQVICEVGWQTTYELCRGSFAIRAK
jgi:hypothetical protein